MLLVIQIFILIKKKLNSNMEHKNRLLKKNGCHYYKSEKIILQKMNLLKQFQTSVYSVKNN